MEHPRHPSESNEAVRANIYSQELTDEVELVEQRSNTGIVYSAVRFLLHSSDKLHSPAFGQDDDRSAVTFWLPKTTIRREELATAFEEAARLIRDAQPETGLD
jgi:hypothetical protein